MTRARDDRRRNRRAFVLASRLPVIGPDGIPHHAEFDPVTGTSHCMTDCEAAAGHTSDGPAGFCRCYPTAGAVNDATRPMRREQCLLHRGDPA